MRNFQNRCGWSGLRGVMGATAVMACCAGAMATTGGAFRMMGMLPGTNSSWGYGVSEDGSYVVGRSGTNFYYGNASHGYCWRSSDNSMLDITPLDPDGTAWGCSGDGSVVVGVRRTGSGGAHSFCCDNNGVDSGASGGGADELYAVSADGSTRVGYETTSGNHSTTRAMMLGASGRWQSVDSASMTGSRAYGVSADGSVVVGGATFDGIGYRAFRWTEAGGSVNIGAGVGGATSEARAVSADGSIVVGVSSGHAMRWTVAAGVQEIGTIPGGTASTAFGVSADGSTIVGSITVPADARTHAFIWTQSGGMRDLQTVLGSLVPAGWRLVEARATTPDGRMIVGTAWNTANEPQAFLATLPSACQVDIDGSGAVDVQDIFGFLSAWFAGDAVGNFNGQGGVDVQDIFEFLAAWFVGC